MAAELIVINHDHDIDYLEEDQNAIGATTSLTLRTITAPGALTTIYVRKFGTIFDDNGAMGIGAFVSTTAGVEDLLYTFSSLDDSVSFGNITDIGGVATDNTAGVISADDGMKIVLSCNVGANVSNEISFTIRGVTVVLPDETLSAGESITFYISNTGSSYYDQALRFGGSRHAPSDGDPDLPYFSLTAAEARLGGAFVIIHVLDSATYDEQFSLSTASTILQAALGQTPTITSGCGARISREVAHDGNNLDTAYVSKTGNDANPGTYQEPYLTIRFAYLNRGARTYLNIMDSETYFITGAIITILAAFTIEPLYGETPTITPLTLMGDLLQLAHADTFIYGLIINGKNVDVGISIGGPVNWAGIIADCTITECFPGGIVMGAGSTMTGAAYITRNIIYNNRENGILIEDTLATSGNITKNIIYNNTNVSGAGIYFIHGGAVFNLSTLINNNIIYNNYRGIYFLSIDAQPTYNGTIENNTITKNTYGIDVLRNGSTWAGTTRDMICYGNTTYDFNIEAGAPTFSRTNYTGAGYLNGWAPSDGALSPTTDPEFCQTTLPYKFGISANSGAHRTDTNSDDMGASGFRIIEINHDTIEINGFYIDGQEQYNNAIYIVDVADHTGTTIRYNSISLFNGIAIDPYDNNVNTGCIITNNLIHANGNGIKLSYGGNTIQENLIYNNTIFGIWSDYTAQDFIHNVFYGNTYGLYLSVNSASITIRDSIFSQNILYDIYSEVATAVTYCCMPDQSVTANVDITDDSNFAHLPLLKNQNLGEEDFHIKTIWGGYTFNSACMDAASDGEDVGGYMVERSTIDDAWKKYQLKFNPQVTWSNIPKGQVSFVNAQGYTDMWAKAHRRGFVFDFSAPQVSEEELRQKMEYFSTLIRKRESTTVEEGTKFRLHFQPDSFLEDGTETVNSTAGTITDITKDWTEQQWRGFHVGVQWTAGVGTGTIAAVAKTLSVVPNPGWVIDEWIGYYFYHNYYYYYILDSTNNTLTLSDPLGTLTNEANIDWNIEKYFKILQSNKNILLLCDGDSELPDGDYYYYISFIEVVINRTDFGYSMPRFLYTREHAKTNYSISFEETRDKRCE